MSLQAHRVQSARCSFSAFCFQIPLDLYTKWRFYLTKCIKLIVVQPFEPVYEEGNTAFEFFIIISGEVTLTRQDMDYSRVLEAGSFFGERELFFSKRYLLRSMHVSSESFSWPCPVLGLFMTSAIDWRRYASTRGSVDGGSSSMELPLLGRKRHQTAIVSSRVRAELKFISWPQIMALSRTSRIIFEKLREAATVRATATGEDTDHKHHEQKRGLVDTLFAQFDQQNVSAKTIQRRWRRRTAAKVRLTSP